MESDNAPTLTKKKPPDQLIEKGRASLAPYLTDLKAQLARTNSLIDLSLRLPAERGKYNPVGDDVLRAVVVL